MMDDREFDLMLEEELELLPLPDQEVAAVNPWEKAMGQIVWGLALTTITINHWYLNYLLPAVGMMLLLLGHRTLRQENKWFAWAWYLTAAESARMFITYTLQATRFELNTLLGWQLAWAALHMAELFCLWQGIRQVRRKAGQPDQAGAVAALMVWSGIILAVALLGGNGWVILLPLLVVYIAIFYNLGKLTRLLDGAGYCITAAPVRVPNWMVVGVYLASLALCIGGCLFAFGHYPMDWQERNDDEQAGCEEIVENLRTLGLPEDMVADLTSEELAALAEAERVLLGRREMVGTDDGGKLLCRSAAIQLPGEERWALLQHFVWQEMPRHRGTEALQITLPYEDYVPGGLAYYAADEMLPARVRLLYDEGESTLMTSPALDPMTATTWFGGNEYTTRYAAWSLPRRGEAARGYLFYGLYRLDDASIVTVTDYVHNQLTVYPFMSARQYSARGFWGDNPKFRTMQYQMSFHYDDL